ncbi:cytochrome-c peroxidase [Ramlibacter albus]|uniref:Cytochrome-c peroxidase n=1 Tax=Ramlibacter albus TaxID=2079448 RepID=A0A923MBD0_9BURK|nr:cytochrome c peroxidase [Ramlibacter albus]MBC5765947.1 cytochrome-c peroxidase [Ramlibacter albus]
MKRACILALFLSLAAGLLYATGDGGWSPVERKDIASLALRSLGPLPPDPSNRFADNERAAEFGQRLFFDKRFSSNGQVACATCHMPDKSFQDGTPLAKGVGTTNRRTMAIVGTARSPWQFWDGRKDSQWAQALGPLESPVEHGGDRMQYARVIADHYRADYESLFGPMPDIGKREEATRVFVNMGKAIAAYERKLEPGASKFDAFADSLARGDADANKRLTSNEIAGLKLFLGKGQCLQCHSGPLLTNHEFHNTGVPAAPGLPLDTGRLGGVRDVLKDEFNCLSIHSDGKPEQCGEIRFLAENRHQERQFRVPSLRNVADRAPYMHAGQLASLRDVVRHYSRAPAAPAGHSELSRLDLSDREVDQLVAFLQTLSGPVAAEPKWLRAP